MALFSTLSELVNKLQTLAVLMALFSKNTTKFYGRLTNCQPWQFWWHKITVTQTADLGSFNGTFQQGGTFGQQTADLGSFNGTFQQRSNVSIKLPTSGSFNAIFQSLWTTYHQTADLGSFYGTFQKATTFGQCLKKLSKAILKYLSLLGWSRISDNWCLFWILAIT